MAQYDVMITIDPGASGGIAIYNVRTGELKAMKLTHERFLVILKPFVGLNIKVYMEKVGTHFRGNNASSTASLAKSYGYLLGVLDALEIPYDEILPSKWQDHYPGRPRGMVNYKKRKAYFKQVAQDIWNGEGWPGRVTMYNSDALLMMNYVRFYFIDYEDTQDVEIHRGNEADEIHKAGLLSDAGPGGTEKAAASNGNRE